MFLHTYTFTIDIVPLVFKDQCFLGHVQEYGGIIVKMHHQRKNKVDPLKENRRRPIQPSQAQPWQRPRTSQEPTCARRWWGCGRTLGVAAPGLAPSPPSLLGHCYAGVWPRCVSWMGLLCHPWCGCYIYTFRVAPFDYISTLIEFMSCKTLIL